MLAEILTEDKALETIFESLNGFLFFEIKTPNPERKKLQEYSPLYAYLASLIRMYPFTHTVIEYIKKWPKLIEKRYSDSSLTKMAEDALNDEKGHDELIKKDILTIGAPFEESLTKIRSPIVQTWIQSFHRSMKRDPIHYLAYLLYFENKSIQTPQKEIIERSQRILGRKKTAVRFVRIHSASRIELEHVKKRKLAIKNLSPENKKKVFNELYYLILHLPSFNQFDIDHRLVIDYFNSIPRLKQLRLEIENEKR